MDLRDHLKAIADTAGALNNAWRQAHPLAPLTRHLDIAIDADWVTLSAFEEDAGVDKEISKLRAAVGAFADMLPDSAKPMSLRVELDDYGRSSGPVTKVGLRIALAGMLFPDPAFKGVDAYFHEYEHYGEGRIQPWIDLMKRLDGNRFDTPNSTWLIINGDLHDGVASGKLNGYTLVAAGIEEARLKFAALSIGPARLMTAMDDGVIDGSHWSSEILRQSSIFKLQGDAVPLSIRVSEPDEAPEPI